MIIAVVGLSGDECLRALVCGILEAKSFKRVFEVEMVPITMKSVISIVEEAGVLVISVEPVFIPDDVPHPIELLTIENCLKIEEPFLVSLSEVEQVFSLPDHMDTPPSQLLGRDGTSIHQTGRGCQFHRQ